MPIFTQAQMNAVVMVALAAIALSFGIGLIVGIWKGVKDERKEAELANPRKVRKLVVVNARSAICPKPELAHSQWAFSPKELG